MVVVNTAYLLVAGMLNQFGTAVSAASNVGLQINTFAGMPCWAIGQAVTAMVGQCMGARSICPAPIHWPTIAVTACPIAQQGIPAKVLICKPMPEAADTEVPN